MKKLIIVLLLVASAARADFTYMQNDFATLALTAGTGTGQLWVAPMATSQLYTIRSAAISGAQTVSGTVTFSLDTNQNTEQATSGHNITWSVGYQRSGGDTTLASGTMIVPNACCGSQLTSSATLTSTALVATDTLWLKFTIPRLTATALPDEIDFFADSQSYVQWPQTMFFCPTAGSTCACNGICGGASCGNQFSTSQSTTCSCDCTVTACATTLSLSGPSGFSCADLGNNSQDQCTWTALSGASTYTETRVSPSATVCNAIAGTSCTDTIGVGSFTYNLTANGTCPPASGVGNTLGSKTTNASSAGVTILQKILGSILNVIN